MRIYYTWSRVSGWFIIVTMCITVDVSKLVKCVIERQCSDYVGAVSAQQYYKLTKRNTYSKVYWYVEDSYQSYVMARFVHINSSIKFIYIKLLDPFVELKV